MGKKSADKSAEEMYCEIATSVAQQAMDNSAYAKRWAKLAVMITAIAIVLDFAVFLVLRAH